MVRQPPSFFVYMGYRVKHLADFFSVKICLSTLFAPWKRDQLSARGLSLQDQFHVAVLNLASRFIGFVVKIIVIGLFIFSLVVLGIIGGLVVILWFGWPVIGIVSIVAGLGQF